MDVNKEIDEACNKGNLNKFTIPQLKFYLRSRGQYVSGKKCELIERVKGAHGLGLKDINIVREEGDNERIRQENDKLKTPLGEQYHHPSKIECWTDDVHLIPELTEKDIYNYFVFKIQTKRQLKAKVMYEDRHVHKIQVSETEENQSHCFVRSKVIPSMPSTNQKQCPDYNVWVMLSKATGHVNSAECDCTAGAGEGCNHISALLYAIADITVKKKNGTIAATSKKCKWNNPRKRKLEPQKSQDITFQKYVHGQNTTISKVLPVFSVNTTVNIERFKEKLLAGNSNVGWLKNFQQEVDRVTLPQLHNIQFNYKDNIDIKSQECRIKFEEYMSSLTATQEDCVKIESLTRNQADSHLWMEARQARLTSSFFGQICKLQKDTKPDSLLKDILGYRTFENIHTKYGKSHEAAARRSYQRYMRDSHPGLVVRKCGLITSPDLPYLGASPDGLVNCTHCQESNGVLEIKCPSKMLWRMKTPIEVAEDRKFFCFIDENNQVKLKRTHRYYYQVQGQLALTGRGWCDFVVWTCKGISVERIFADTDFIGKMMEKLSKFYVDCFIPELFTARIKRSTIAIVK